MTPGALAEAIASGDEARILAAVAAARRAVRGAGLGDRSSAWPAELLVSLSWGSPGAEVRQGGGGNR